MWGAGMTNGEDVEQNWEFTNGAAGSTKMMGPGGRHVFLEGVFSFHNWMRTVSYLKVFGRQMARDLKEGKQHREAFEAFTALVEGERPDVVEKWKRWVLTWESEQHMDGHASLFEMAKPSTTMQDIRLQLGKAELTQTGAGIEVERQHTSSTFISMGLDIKESQRILTIDVKALANPTLLQELDFVKRRTALLKRIRRFRKLQQTYMPECTRFLMEAQREVWNKKNRVPEAIKLFLPSELSSASRAQACEKGLDAIEEEMREAELQESLEELRQALRTRMVANYFGHRNTTSQQALTHGQGLLQQIAIQILKAKLRCRYARNAYLRLKGHGPWEKVYNMLNEEDVRGINKRAASKEEEAERQRLRELGEIVEGGIARAGVVAAGGGNTYLIMDMVQCETFGQ
ncbi:CxC2 domain-containing protein [Mycena venus]|uniref:CxC2 domain-containing protein n=1 Tax=Mycena venus TaxID=2733690 RepID=A0A8H6XL30_9AGAR|nr:CxC2 domain-containing protein [Mycena venus]